MAFVTRFAPSPTGPLHLGHAYSALLAFDRAQAKRGTFLLRIEDIDSTRCRPIWENQITADLAWLGITWGQPMLRQSDRAPAYQAALDDLWARGLLYPCTCTRRDIDLALGAPQEGVTSVSGPDGPIYPGTCRPAAPLDHIVRPKDQHLRLNMRRAIASLQDRGTTAPNFLQFTEIGPAHHGTIRVDLADYPDQIGDIILARKDFGTSYHLSVVLDDAAQGVTDVIRGQDLFEATQIHVLLQRLLDLPTPTYHHHRLIRDDMGKRLAKRDDARALAKFRAEGATPADIRRMIGVPRTTDQTISDHRL